MKFEGDIIITDPCYLIKKRKGEPRMDDYPILAGKYAKKFTDFTTEENEAYAILTKAREEWERNNPDDWDRCAYGDDMSELGFTTHLVESTGYGDWSCTTYNSDTKAVLGEFCADAGLVGVFLLSEILAYNPDYDGHIKNPHTTTWIRDFHGDIIITYNSRTDSNKVVGTGNINFYTEQTGG